MTPQGARTLIAVCAIGLVIWLVLITVALLVFATDGQPVTLPTP